MLKKKHPSKPVKIDKHDKRIGNFFIHEEPEYFKCSDLGGLVQWRVSKHSNHGILIAGALEDNNATKNKWLESYAAIYFQLLNMPFTGEFANFLMDAIEKANAYIQEHPELLGLSKEELSKAQDDAILKDLKEEHEEQEALEKELNESE